MKEIHAYRNKDGTYRVEAIGEVLDGNGVRDVVVKAACAKISIDVLMVPDSGELYTVIMEED